MDRLIGLDLTENAVSGVGQLRTYDAGILIVSKNTLEILQDLRSAFQPALHVYHLHFYRMFATIGTSRYLVD